MGFFSTPVPFVQATTSFIFTLNLIYTRLAISQILAEVFTIIRVTFWGSLSCRITQGGDEATWIGNYWHFCEDRIGIGNIYIDYDMLN